MRRAVSRRGEAGALRLLQASYRHGIACGLVSELQRLVSPG